MKLIKPTLLILLLIAVHSCNNKKSKNQDPVKTEIRNQTIEKTMINETEQNVQENLQPLELIVKKMLTTSPRYHEITKGLQKKVVENGGLYFGIYLNRNHEQSTRNKGNYNKAYEFTIYEMYEERQLNTYRFSFNPKNKQLYEYDNLNDSLLPIEYDRTLLLQYDSIKNKDE